VEYRLNLNVPFTPEDYAEWVERYRVVVEHVITGVATSSTIKLAVDAALLNFLRYQEDWRPSPDRRIHIIDRRQREH
jgi:hypothetical protein